MGKNSKPANSTLDGSLPYIIGLGVAVGLLAFTAVYAYYYVQGWESKTGL
jgi:hypothetical protein